MLSAPSIGYGATRFFKPTDLGSGLKLLLEAKDISQSAGVVTTWADTSGNGSNLTAHGSPGYTANNGGGLPAVTFNGSSQYMDNAVTITNRSFFAVVSGMNNTAVACLCGAGRIYAQLGVNNQMAVFANSFAPVSGQTMDTARHSIAIIQRAANDVDFYLDGAKVTVTTGASFYIDSPVSLGAENAPQQYTLCHVEHVSICDTARSNADVQQMLAYIKRVYGV